MKKDNPFKYGSIVDKEGFCNRKEEIFRLKSYIQSSQSLWLYSPRRFGKTSLINRVFEETKSGKCLYLDLYNIKSVDDFCKRYAQLIANELFDWKDNIRSLSEKFIQNFKGLKPSVVFDEKGTPSFSLQLEAINQQTDVETILNIPHKICEKSGQKICIAFDEFQEIKRIDPFLINWMRSAFQFHKNICYIFLGSKQSLMKSIFSDQNSPFYEFGMKMQLNPIKQEELANFINERFKSRGLKVEPSVVDKILEITEGHPHYTQFFASEVFYLILTGENQKDVHFNKKWLNKIINGQSDIFQNIYDQLSNIQRTVLLTLSRLSVNEELYSAETKEKYKLPVSSSLNTALHSLIKKDIVAKHGTQYIISNPVFKEWLRTI